MGLSAKQEAFCRFYCANGGNATAAAKAAKYSEKTAEQQGYQLLQKTSVREFIEKLKAPVHEALDIDAAWIREKLKEETDHKQRRDSTQAGRIRALELLGKDMGMWKEEKPVVPPDSEKRMPPPIAIDHEDAGADEETRSQYASASGAHQ